MVERSFDAEHLHQIVGNYPEIVGEDYSVTDWLDNTDNIALREGDNYGLFEFEYPGVYTGHYFFHTARGTDAYDLAKRMLHEMYSNQGAHIIRGLTPVDKTAAARLTRRLGFTSYDIVHTLAGPCELFIMSLDEFYGRHNPINEVTE